MAKYTKIIDQTNVNGYCHLTDNMINIIDENGREESVKDRKVEY